MKTEKERGNAFGVILLMAALFSAISTCCNTGCGKKEETPEPIIYGCTDPAAKNYNPNATQSDGTCIYPTVREKIVSGPWKYMHLYVAHLTNGLQLSQLDSTINDGSTIEFFDNNSYIEQFPTLPDNYGTWQLLSGNTSILIDQGMFTIQLLLSDQLKVYSEEIDTVGGTIYKDEITVTLEK